MKRIIPILIFVNFLCHAQYKPLCDNNVSLLSALPANMAELDALPSNTIPTDTVTKYLLQDKGLVEHSPNGLNYYYETKGACIINNVIYMILCRNTHYGRTIYLLAFNNNTVRNPDCLTIYDELSGQPTINFNIRNNVGPWSNNYVYITYYYTPGEFEYYSTDVWVLINDGICFHHIEKSEYSANNDCEDDVDSMYLISAEEENQLMSISRTKSFIFSFFKDYLSNISDSQYLKNLVQRHIRFTGFKPDDLREYLHVSDESTSCPESINVHYNQDSNRFFVSYVCAITHTSRLMEVECVLDNDSYLITSINYQ